MVKLGDIAQIAQDLENGVLDFTVNGECSNCGSCCSNYLPMMGHEIKAIRSYIAKNDIREQRHLIPTANPYKDFICPFRDNSKRRCTIYPARPAICRDFRCDKVSKGANADTRMYREEVTLVDVRDTFFRNQGRGSNR